MPAAAVEDEEETIEGVAVTVMSLPCSACAMNWPINNEDDSEGDDDASQTDSGIRGP